eukprot:SAG31_NODE_123_length_23712_cov_41.426291_38_plen_76_part_00
MARLRSGHGLDTMVESVQMPARIAKSEYYTNPTLPRLSACAYAAIAPHLFVSLHILITCRQFYVTRLYDSLQVLE